MRHGKYRFLAGAMIRAPGAVRRLRAVAVRAGVLSGVHRLERRLQPRRTRSGLANFTRLWSDPLFLAALRHNGLMLLVVPLATIALALFFAAPRPGAPRVYRVVYFFPQLLSVAIIAVLWQFVYTPNSGLLNGFLDAVGLPLVEAVAGSPSRIWRCGA